MSEERKRILEMLAQGKLSGDEAERLLTARGDPPGEQPEESEPDTETDEDDDGFNVLDDLGDEFEPGWRKPRPCSRTSDRRSLLA